jgi:hypothetical protein
VIALLEPARVAFFVAGGLAGEIMALTKKQKARRAAIIKILTEISRNGGAKRGPGPFRIGPPACECSLTKLGLRPVQVGRDRAKGEGILHEAASAYGGINPFDERVCSGRL